MSTTTATELFERGKGYFKDKKYNKALDDFSEAVRLEPSNADYHAWLARTYLNSDKYAECLASVNQALQLNPHCQLAYRVRAGVYRKNKDYQKAIQGYSQAIQIDPQDALSFRGRGQAYMALKDYEKAIQDFSQAIQLDPQEAGSFYWRGQTYYALKDYENALADEAEYHRLDSDWKLGVWPGQKTEFNAWYKTIHQHLTENLLSGLRVGDERFVEYWPCTFEWGKRTDQNMYSGTSYTEIYGAFGTGYLCLTNRNIHLVSIGRLNEKFPRYKTGIFFSILGGVLTNTHDHRKPEKEDKVWKVSYKSITDAHMDDDHIVLISPTITCEIYEHFNGQLQIILAGINLGLSGRFAAREITSVSREAIRPANINIVDLLKQLGELKAQGIITDTEFDEKKKDLLARL
jgi:tetratricopeptide (TPR) repeat protein